MDLQTALPTTLNPQKKSKRVYGLYKNNNAANEDEKGKTVRSTDNRVIANLSVADTLHDFTWDPKSKTGFANLKGDLNGKYKTIYNGGLPSSFDTIEDEENVLKSVFKDIPESYNVPLDKIKKIRAGFKKSDTIKNYDNDKSKNHMKAETINDNSYTITFCDAKPIFDSKKDYINAETFYKNLGLDSDGKQKYAFVIDCTSVSIDTILTSGPKIENSVYLIKAPEIENDPGGKKKLDDKQFTTEPRNGNYNGVYFRPAIPYNIVAGKDYYYTFKNDSVSPMNQFFTKYTFKLSELKYVHKYISSKISTTLTILPTQNIALPPVDDSGDNNEIGALTKIINNLLRVFGKKKTNEFETPTQEFEFVGAFQQKRSGDWLQALLACLIASGEREFCEYKKDGFFKKKDLQKASEPNPSAPNPSADEKKLNFDRVFLVTHDRILLAFALLLGIDVMFTHHYSDTELKTSVSSVLLYTITNEEQEQENKIKYMKDFIRDWSDDYFDIKPLVKNITEWKKNIDNTISSITNKLAGKSSISEKVYNNYQVFETETKEIFKVAFKTNTMKTTLPNFNNFTIKKANETDKNRFFSGEFFRITLANNATIIFDGNNTITITKTAGDKSTLTLNYENVVEIRKMYDSLKIEYESCNKQYVNIRTSLEKEGGYESLIETQLKKNAAYQLIIGWRITNHPKFNLWSEYKNVIPNEVKSTYINDKNIFLYELTNLDPISKEKIYNFYQKWYDETLKVKEGNTMGMPVKMIEKLKSNMLSFCFEVFINFKEQKKDLDDRQAEIDLRTLKTEIDNKMGEVKLVDDSIKPISQAEIKVEEKDESTFSDFNNNLANSTNSRLMTIVDEQIALDGVITNGVDNEVNPTKNDFNNTLILSGETVNQVNASSVIDIPLSKMFESDADAKDTNIEEKLREINRVISDEIHSQAVPVQTGGDNGQLGGALQNRRFDIIYNYDNVTAPIMMNVVSLFKDQLLYQNEGLNITIENFLNISFNVLPANKDIINYDPDDLGNSDRIATKIIDQLLGANNQAFKDTLKKKSAALVSSYRKYTEEKEDREKNNNKMMILVLLAIIIAIVSGIVSGIVAFKPSSGGADPGSEKPEEEKTDFDTTENEKYIENTDILINDKLTFHPLLPVFLILRSYCFQLSEVSIEECWEFDIYITYILLVNAIVKKMVNAYSGKNNNNINKFITIIHGYGLRELLFTANQYSDWDTLCMQTLGLDDSINYNEFSGLSSVMSNLVAGEINQTTENKAFGKKCIENSFFSDFIKDLNVKQYFQHTINPNSDIMTNFRSNVLQYYLKVGEKISNDQKGLKNEELDTYLRTFSLLDEKQSPPIITMPLSDTDKLRAIRREQGPPRNPINITTPIYKEKIPMGTMTSLLNQNKSSTNPNYIYNTVSSRSRGGKRTKRLNKNNKKKYTRRKAKNVIKRNKNNKTRKQTRRKRIIKKRKYSISNNNFKL